MRGVPAPDAMDQMKKAFKGLFSKKKAKKEEPKPTAATETPSNATPASEPAKTETAPAPAPATAPAPAEPVPAAAPAQGEANKDEVAALAEVKRATQSRSTSHYSSTLQVLPDHGFDGSRWRHRVVSGEDWETSNDWGGPL